MQQIPINQLQNNISIYLPFLLLNLSYTCKGINLYLRNSVLCLSMCLCVMFFLYIGCIDIEDLVFEQKQRMQCPNINLVQQLWISRSELSVIATDMKMSNQPFSSAYVCIIASNTSSQVPQSSLYTFSALLNQTVMTFQPTTIFNSQPQILNVSQSRPFQCYNMQGAVVNEDISMNLIIEATMDHFDFIFRIFTSDQIIGKNTASNYIYYEQAANATRPMYLNYIYMFKKIHGVIYDSLLIDYQPQVIEGFSDSRTFVIGDSSYEYSKIKFTTQTSKPYDTTSSYTITRTNIGNILGTLLSWFSVFVLIAAFGIAPILKYNYQVQLSKKLYDHPKLTRIQTSIFSYLKYVLSWFKRNIFDESILYTAFQQLQKDLDLMNLIKKQIMMKKLIKQNEFVNKEIDHLHGGNIIENDDQKQTQQLFISKFLNTNHLLPEEQNCHQQSQSNSLHCQSTQQKAPLITQPDPQNEQSFIVSFFKSFDASQTRISLICNKGEGYKTSWNTILTAICAAGVLWFIIYAGIFQMKLSYSVTSVALDYNDTVIPNITINPEDIIFRANHTSPFNTFILQAFIIDQNDQILQNLTLLEGADCDEYKANLNQSSSGWYCLQKGINLYNNGKGNKTKLAIKIQYGGFNFFTNYIETIYWQYNIIDEQLAKTKVYNYFPYSTNQVYRFDGQAIIYVNSDQQQSIPNNVSANPNSQFWTCNKYSLTTETIFTGITYEIQPQLIKITEQQPTIWDVINNAWGIVVLAFSVFLSKITRYLNVKQRQKITKGEQNQTRNDIVAIISTQYKLLYHVFNKELQQVKYFYKTNLRDFSTKSR